MGSTAFDDLKYIFSFQIGVNLAANFTNAYTKLVYHTRIYVGLIFLKLVYNGYS